MKNYLRNSVLISIAILIIGWIYTSSLLLGITAGIAAFLLSVFWNPKRRYIRIFSYLLTFFISSNKFFFELSGNILGIDFQLLSNNIHPYTNIAFIFLMGICLYLDYKERSDPDIAINSTGKFTLFRISSLRLRSDTLEKYVLIAFNIRISNTSNIESTFMIELEINYVDSSDTVHTVMVKHFPFRKSIFKKESYPVFDSTVRLLKNDNKIGWATFKVPKEIFKNKIKKYSVRVMDNNNSKSTVDAYIITELVA